MALRPQIESSNKYALKCAWSNYIEFRNIPKLNDLKNKKIYFCHLKCVPTAGGLKPIWLYLSLSLDRTKTITEFTIKAPVVVYNYLPLPTDVILKCQNGQIPGLKGKINPKSIIFYF